MVCLILFSFSLEGPSKHVEVEFFQLSAMGDFL